MCPHPTPGGMIWANLNLNYLRFGSSGRSVFKIKKSSPNILIYWIYTIWWIRFFHTSFLTNECLRRRIKIILGILLCNLSSNCVPLCPYPASGDHDSYTLEFTLPEDSSTSLKCSGQPVFEKVYIDISLYILILKFRIHMVVPPCPRGSWFL